MFSSAVKVGQSIVLPDVGTWLDLSRVQAQRCRRHATPSQYCNHFHPLLSWSVLAEMFPLQNTSSAVGAQRGYLARDLRTKGMSPTHRLRCNLVE